MELKDLVLIIRKKNSVKGKESHLGVENKSRSLRVLFRIE